MHGQQLNSTFYIYIYIYIYIICIAMKQPIVMDTLLWRRNLKLLVWPNDQTTSDFSVEVGSMWIVCAAENMEATQLRIHRITFVCQKSTKNSKCYNYHIFYTFNYYLYK